MVHESPGTSSSALFASQESAGTVDFRIDGKIAYVTLNRPAKRNALRYSMWASLADHFRRIAREDGLVAAVIAGAGSTAFAAGADIKELATCLGDRTRTVAYMAMAEEALSALADCPLPVIAAIKGFCIGAGLEIAMACDLRLATIASRFGAPPAKLGANYSFDSTKRLLELVGPGLSRMMLYTGGQWSGPEAFSSGLIDLCSDDIDTALEQLIQTLSSNSPFSIKVAKQTIRDIERGLLVESRELRELRISGFAHGDLREGIASFLQKRTPNFRAAARPIPGGQKP
jgi:enoyl-CoA hydratase